MSDASPSPLDPTAVATDATTTATESSPHITDLASSPIPLNQARATSHVDQLQAVSPPHPPPGLAAVSPTSEASSTGVTLSSSPEDSTSALPDSPTLSSPSVAAATAASPAAAERRPSKPHPADLVCAANPDPHRSLPTSPADVASSASESVFGFEGSVAATTSSISGVGATGSSTPLDGQGGHHHHHRSSHSHQDGAESEYEQVEPSENGVTLGSHHGGESDDEGGTDGHGSVRENGGSRRRSSSGVGTGTPDRVREETEEEERAQGEQSDKVEAIAFQSTTTTPATTNGTTDSSPSTRRTSHNRSQSMASPSSTATSAPPPSYSTPIRPTNGTSTSSPHGSPTTSSSRRDASSTTTGASQAEKERERERRNERRDREREKQARAEGGGGEKDGKEATSSSSRSRRVLGEWTMTKTLGAGSMGKVKLGVSNVTGEKVAIKIIPRFTSTAAAHRPPPPSSSEKDHPTSTSASPRKESASSSSKEPYKPTESFLAKAAAKDQSKEVRTTREGSLCLLLHHPYVCGMKSMMVYPNHYYMVCEYVNGGQLLDYIISHGRLRERSARKFARQIGSALEYCHANSIVHRDLKIENILISKTGNIKIIDFGLSNLYTPTSLLTTFCGSLYFAAPELLNAKPYTGPEVDVWSFGIVLYVLVCGKVPFDDQSMPALHAKIKRGQVEYPSWLSSECKHLLSRMLVTNPMARATLSEVLSHPWVTKGFGGPPSSHLPPRLPLRPDEIDRDVIKGMVGFELGTDHEIHATLLDVLSSDAYRTAVRAWEAKKAGVFGFEDEERPSELRPATRTDGKDMKGLGRSPTSKRFSGLGFYGKKLAQGVNAALSGGPSAPSRHSEEANGYGGGGDLSNNSSSGTLSNGTYRPDVLDPTKGFHPVLSIYYLVKEKLAREKIWGPGVFASSTLSLTGPPPPPAPAMAYQAGAGLVPPPQSLARPPSAASPNSPQLPPSAAEPPTASPLIPMTPQPRQRATNDEFASSHAPASAPNAFHNKRSSFHASATVPLPGSPSAPSSFARAAFEPASPTPQRPATAIPTSRPSQTEADDIPLGSTSPSLFARRFGSLLGRSSTAAPPHHKDDAAYKGHRQRASIGGSAYHKAGNKTAVSALPQVDERSHGGGGGGSPTIRPSGSDVPLQSPPEGKAVARASTVGELSPSRHQRGVSMGAAPAGTASLGRAQGAQMGERRRLASMGERGGLPRPRTSGDVQGMFDEGDEEELTDRVLNGAGAAATTNGRRHHGDTETEDEEDDDRASLSHQQQQDVGFIGRTAAASSSNGGSESTKPVWLKGLFSVTTTTTKPAAQIRTDLIRVLDRLGVQHRDVKSGFECAHVPSIDLSSVGKNNGAAAATAAPGTGSNKGTIRRRASKLLLSNNKDKEAQHGTTNGDESSTSLHITSSDTRDRTRTTSSTSFGASPTLDSQPSTSPTLAQGAKFNSSTAEGSTVSSELIVRFEIFIVRMPLLPGISGLQFRRIGGNAWQYQQLARRILSELKL